MTRVDFSTIPEELERYPWPIMLNQGYHWMDKYGEGYWIEDMETSHLENCIPFAYSACSSMATLWMEFAITLGGEHAQDAADHIMDRYIDYDVPLIRGLENELARRNNHPLPHEHIGGDGMSFLEAEGYRVMDAFLQPLGEKAFN